MLGGDARVRRFVDAKLDVNGANSADVDKEQASPEERRLKGTLPGNWRNVRCQSCPNGTVSS
jgi:hypothetical protein